MEELLELTSLLGDRVLTTAKDVAPYAADASRAIPGGLPRAVVRAHSTEDVSMALSWAHRFEVPVSVRGAGSGLAGGAVSYSRGLVISLAEMNRIIEFHPGNRIVEVEAGVITADIDDAAAEIGLMYAPDPASYRISTIGGNIATNAGGLRCVKHGVTHDSIAGLEVVLANGDIIHTGSKTRKNVVGYNLTSLFVGSEGTLGVVTKATLRLKPRPTGATQTFRATFPTLESAGEAVTAIMASLITPEVMELLDQRSIEAVERHYPSGLQAAGASVLVGQFIGVEAEREAQVAAQLSRAAGATDVKLAADDTLIEARRHVSAALSAESLRAACDVAVPVNRLAEMFGELDRISGEQEVVISTFAHAGDGNLHPGINLVDDRDETYEKAEYIMELISEAAVSLGGTISGEHGVGSLKVGSMRKQLGADHAAHLLIKNAFDPKGILSPGRGI